MCLENYSSELHYPHPVIFEVDPSQAEVSESRVRGMASAPSIRSQLHKYV